MRIVATLVAVIVVLGWLGFELRSRSRDISNGLFGLCALLALLLVGALLGVYD